MHRLHPGLPGRGLGGSLAGQLSRKVCPQAWGSFAFLFQGLRDDQPIVFVREDCQATVFASDFGAKLPQTMGGVPNGLPFVGFIDARTVD